MNWQECLDNYVSVLKRYSDFEGRARRKEFWMFVLGNIIVSVALMIVIAIIPFLFFVHFVYWLAVLLPSVAVGIRRLHDTGRSGWWMLLCPVPLANLVPLIFVIMDSQPGANEYGPNPKQVGSGNSSNVSAGAA